MINKFDKKYEARANHLLQQIIDEGLTVEEVRYILRISEIALDRRVNELKLQSSGQA